MLLVGLSPAATSLALLGILVGGLVNIPIHRTRYTQLELAQWVTFHRRWGVEPFPIGMLRGNTIAINVGGAIVPLAIAVWATAQIANEPIVLASLALASLVNSYVCYRLGRVVANVGILLPAWVAPMIGVGMAWLLLPSGSPQYASFAFVTAVIGPFVGADLLNLRDVQRVGVGTMSIGGAGPFDGIVLSGVIAAWLA